MFFPLTARHLSTRGAICLVMLIAGPRSVAWSQSVLDPHVIEFLPSPQNNVILTDGQPAVTGYQAEISVSATSQVLQLISLGKPAVQPDGMIRTDFANTLSATPAAGVVYVSRVLTIGPRGTAVSVPSSPFSFSPCNYRFAAATASVPAAGSSASVDVLVTGIACGWTPVSSAPWLVVDTGALGSGTRTLAFKASRNTGLTSRTATIALGGVSYAVTQGPEGSRIVQVSTEGQLQAAIATLTTNTTIVIAPGIYRLTSTLHISGNLAGVTIKGSTGRPADVVLEGAGMTVAGGAPTAIWVTGAVQRLQIADLTIQRFFRYAILLEGGPQAPRLSNLRLLDSGDALIKTTADPAGPGVDDGIVEGSSLEYTTTGAGATAGGIDLRGAKRWAVRGNMFRNVRAAGGLMARPAVSASAGSSETLVERNVLVNCQIGIALGLVNLAGAVDHRGGRITNNFFYRAPNVSGRAGISVADSPGTVVLHNTVIASQTSASTIEYRYPDATSLVVANNLVDGPIQALDGAWALQTGNVTNATPGLFVFAAAGDLHLLRTAAIAIDTADSSASVPVDIDGQSRPTDRGPDVGADEVSQFAEPPTVQVVQPVSGAVFKSDAVIQLQVSTGGPNNIAFVDLYVNATLVGRLTNAPYVASVSITAIGTYSIVAVAVDNAGARSASQTISIVVN